MGSKAQLMRCRINLQAEQSSQQWTDYHGRRPYLTRRTGSERLVIIPGKNFRDMSQRSVEGQQRVRAQVRVRRLGTMIAIFTHRGPSREQWPYRSEVIAAGIVQRILR